MMILKTQNKKGNILLLLMVMIGVLLPIIINGILEVNYMSNISRRTKSILVSAAKGAANQKNAELIPTGVFKIEPILAEAIAVDMISRNTGITFTKNGNIYEGISEDTGFKMSFCVIVYNETHKDNHVLFPNEGQIPEAITATNVRILVDRPTVFIISKYEYKTGPLFLSAIFDLVHYTSAQLND